MKKMYIIIISIILVLSFLTWLGLHSAPDRKEVASTYVSIPKKMRPELVFNDPNVISLAQAVAAGNVDEVKRILASGVNVKTKGKQGFTVTHYALLAKQNAPEVLKIILEAGADPISRLEDGDEGGNDVPYYAAARDNADPAVVAVLLDAGVSPSQTVGIERLSWLQAAISGRNMPVVRLLLQRGADVNYNHPFSGTALHTAGVVPDYDIMVFLLDHGANPHLRDNQSPEIAADVPRYTPAEAYCRFHSGKFPNPSPKQLAGFEAMKQAFARRGVALPCGI